MNDIPFPMKEATGDLDWSRLGDRPLCDPCLGRLVAHLGYGMANSERGSLLRAEFRLPPADQCWLCNGLFTEVDKFAALTIKALGKWEYDTFLIGSKISNDIASRQDELWSEVGPHHSEPLKAEINREVGKRVESLTGKLVDFERPDIVAIVDTQFDFIDLQVNSVLIKGRYRKLVRGVPQTKWPCRKCRGKGCEHCQGRGKMYETSVEEIIASAVMDQTDGAGHALHGLGREDVDARMLGRGRPFVVEVLSPRRRTVDLDSIAGNINGTGKVEVSNLQRASKEDVQRIKGMECDKTYRLLARLSSPLNEEKLKEGIASLLAEPVRQRTPIRVSHRRADRIRERRVRAVEVERFDGTTLELVIRAEAGSYIKELVHGDEGRTEPSLAGSLGIPVEVLELDVLEVHDEE